MILIIVVNPLFQDMIIIIAVYPFNPRYHHNQIPYMISIIVVDPLVQDTIIVIAVNPFIPGHDHNSNIHSLFPNMITISEECGINCRICKTF